MLRSLAALLVLATTVSAQWYSYTPPSPCAPMTQCPYPGVYPGLNVGIDYAPYIEAVMRFTGDANVAGAIAFFDLDPTIQAPPGAVGPRMYEGIYPLDWAIVTVSPPWIWPFVPAQVVASQTTTAGTVQSAPSNGLGPAFTVDVYAFPGESVGVGIGKLHYSPSVWPPGFAAYVNVHIVCNMLHERDGSGWAVLFWAGEVTL